MSCTAAPASTDLPTTAAACRARLDELQADRESLELGIATSREGVRSGMFPRDIGRAQERLRKKSRELERVLAGIAGLETLWALLDARELGQAELPWCSNVRTTVKPANCPDCGTWNGTGAACLKVKCLACGAEQCHSRGLGRGACHVCHFGMLPGWSRNNNPIDPATGRPAYPNAGEKTSILCSYAGCPEMAVYNSLPGSKPVACKKHGDAVVARENKKRDERRARWRT